jgi:hypothetical protein
MRAAEQWTRIEADLPEGWEEARLTYTVEAEKAAAGAAAVLAPLGPGRLGRELRFHVRPSGAGGAESVRNLLGRLDRKRIWGDLALLDVRAPEAGSGEARSQKAPGAASVSASELLADAWDALLETVPPDWSDLHCELEVDSSDYVPRAALLGAPLNPSRNSDELALRFRVSLRGYGTSPSMARRCFERMDDEGITGRLAVLNGLSEAGYAATLGPVWRVAGRSV